MVLTDAQWAVLEPLIEAYRPHRKTQHHHLRRTMEAIIWRCQNGTKWRAVPAEYGPWWMAARCFIRRGKHGVWERLLSLVQEKGMRLGMIFSMAAISGRIRRPPVWPKGGSGARRDAREALGRSRGGYDTKACVIADGGGRAVAFTLAPGQAHELPMACALLNCLPETPTWVVADRGYTSHALREHIWALGAQPAIPQRHGALVACRFRSTKSQSGRAALGAAQGMARRGHPLRENRSILPQRPLPRRITQLD